MVTLVIFLNTVALYFLLAFVLSWFGRTAFQPDTPYGENGIQDQNRPVRVELILANSGEKLEYVMRNIIFYSREKGIPIAVYPRDLGSKDETLSILRLFRRDYPGLIRDGNEQGDWRIDLH